MHRHQNTDILTKLLTVWRVHSYHLPLLSNSCRPASRRQEGSTGEEHRRRRNRPVCCCSQPERRYRRIPCKSGASYGAQSTEIICSTRFVSITELRTSRSSNIEWTGLQSLRRYFELIVFQSYLQSTEPDTMRNFQAIETYVDNLPGKIAENDEDFQTYLFVSFPQ